MKEKYVLICSVVSFILLLCVFLIPPRIVINEEETVIEYGSEYIVPEATGVKFWHRFRTDAQSNIDCNIVGEYTITYSLKYLFFNVSKTRKVRVIDTVSPVINLNGNMESVVCPNGEYEEEGYYVTDEYDGDISNQVIREVIDGGVKYTVKDSSGNETSAIRKIIKKDEEKPTISLKGKSTVYLYVGNNYKENGYSSYDNCEGDTTSKVQVKSNVDNTKPGTYYVTYSVEDNSKNNTSVRRKVVVLSMDTGTNTTGTIYLTFDDGPSRYTNRLLDVLRENNVKATFFVTSSGGGSDNDILRAYNDGHTIGLHTYTHNYSLVYSSVDAYFNDLNLISERVKNITGIESKIIRFPGGSSNTVSKRYSPKIMSELANEVINRGYKYYDWNVSSGDAGGVHTSDGVFYNVVNNLKKDRMNMVLMHDTKGFSVEAVQDIINYGKANGYTFLPITMNTKMVKHSISN